MTREQAELLSRKLAREHPERDRYRWLARHGEGDEWSVVKIRLPDALRHDPTRATTEAKPKPPNADDPRPPMFRDVGGPYGTIG
jgi:hypothetical protein